MNKTGDLRIDEIMPQLEDRWLKLPFEACLQKETARYKKLKKRDFGETGKIPVVDQGERLIAGYTDDQGSLYQGSLPVVVFGDHTRRIKYVDFPFAVGADGTKLLHPIKALSPRFFYFYMRALSLESQGYSRHYRFLKHIEVPVPHLNEQHRIVAKLEKLLAKVDKCKERLEKIPVILKRFRQSVLTAAFSGELTKDWRLANKSAIAASDMIKLKQDEIRKQYQSDLRACKRLGVKRPRKPKLIELKDQVNHQEIRTWADLRLEFLFMPGDIFDGPFGTNLKTSDYTKNGVRVVRLENIGFLEFMADKTTYISEEKYCTLKKHTVGKGDLIFASFISDCTRTVILPEIGTAIAKADCFCLRPIKDLVDPKYLAIILSSGKSYEDLRSSVHGATRPRINTTQLKKLWIPLPPMAEQHEIVNRVEKFFRIANELETRYEKAERHVNQLTQSILAKAFRGELVPQDPNDEPASELLKRIKIEREQPKKTQKTKTKRTAKNPNPRTKSKTDMKYG